MKRLTKYNDLPVEAIETVLPPEPYKWKTDHQLHKKPKSQRPVEQERRQSNDWWELVTDEE